MADTAAQPGVVPEPLRNYNFMVTVRLGTGASPMFFTEVTGIGVRVAPISYREAGSNQVVRSFTGQVTYPPVTLRYGLSPDRQLWDWLMSAASGQPHRSEVEIAVLDATGTREATAFVLHRAWPSEWIGAPLRSLGGEIASDTLVLTYEGVERRG